MQPVQSRVGAWTYLGGILGPVQAGGGYWDQSGADTGRGPGWTGAGTSPEGILEPVEAGECWAHCMGVTGPSTGTRQETQAPAAALIEMQIFYFKMSQLYAFAW